MANGRTIEAPSTSETTEATHAEPLDSGFGAEFRDLARTRRFVREQDTRAAEDVAPAPVAPESEWQRAIAATRAAATPRISEDQRAVIAELARMSDRLVESREALARAIARAEHAEAAVATGQQQLMAARALVLDAQRTTQDLATHCAGLEARCSTLDEALHVALNANFLTRWKWRRQLRDDA